MNDRLASIKQEILEGIEKSATSRATAFELRKQFLDSKTGKIGQLMKEMKSIAPEERAAFGKGVNDDYSRRCFLYIPIAMPPKRQ